MTTHPSLPAAPVEAAQPSDEQQPIPISAGKRIAEEFGYDQVVIVGRRVGGFEHVTTYGKDKENCRVAARMGDFFKHKLMGWPEPLAVLVEPAAWMREWEGDDSDLGHMLFVAHADERDEPLDRWQPLYAAPAVPPKEPEQQGHPNARSGQFPDAAGGGWISVEDRPIPRDGGTFLVAGAGGQVVPYIRGVLHNNVGSPWDWNYGEAITHWMPLPDAPSGGSGSGSD